MKIFALRSRSVLVVIVVAIIVVSSAVTALVITGVIPLSTALSCLGVSTTSRTFTIIASNDGYNDSRSLVGLGIWPIMSVHRCDSVTLTVTNTDTQAHGLAVSIYAVPGLTVAAGQTLSLSFTAYKIGQFRVYCTIICSIHDYMLNGQFNVT